MKKYTDKEIKKIYNDLNNGAIYCGVCNNKGVGMIYASGLYIRWQHYGQSANKNTPENLRWLIENIFIDCDIITPAIYSKYHVNYIPVNEKYTGIDFSMNHPNIYGL